MKISFKKFITAASILKVSVFKAWIGREWLSGYFSKGLEAIQEIAEKFLFPKENIAIKINLITKMYQLQLLKMSLPKTQHLINNFLEMVAKLKLKLINYVYYCFKTIIRSFMKLSQVEIIG